MSTMPDHSQIQRPQFPIRKPEKKNNIIHFTTKEQSFVILATEQDLHSVMLQWLDKKKYNFTEIEGGYQLQDGSNNFVVEDAVLVSRDIAVELWTSGWMDTQESILHLYRKDYFGRYKVELIFLNDPEKNNVDIGWFINVDKEKALANPDGYTYRIDTSSYFIAQLDI